MFLLGMRWYDAQTGRFINRDPISFIAQDKNLLSYALNNPANLIDPNGLSPTWLCCAGLLALGAWEFVEKLVGGACVGKSGGEWVGCILWEAIKALIPGKDLAELGNCLYEALKKESVKEKVAAAGDCFKGEFIAPARDAGKLILLLCCFPGAWQLIKSKLPNPAPIPIPVTP
jgi:hypothetical protein